MTAIQVDRVSDYPHESDKFVSAFIDNLQPNGDSLVAIKLGGAHAKGLANSRSDYDLCVYYLRGIDNLINLRPKSFTYLDKNFDIVDKDGVTLINFDGMEVELTLRPLYSISAHLGKALLPQIVKQNGKDIVDYLKWLSVLPLGMVTNLKMGNMFMGIDIRNYLTTNFHYEAEPLLGYFKGYMTSQLMRHRRKLDYKRAENKSVKENTIDPIVKQIIEGVNIGLTGIAFIKDANVVGNFVSMFIKYKNDIFSDYNKIFIGRCYEHKTDKIHFADSPRNFIAEAREVRESIFQELLDYYDANIGEGKDNVIPFKIGKSEHRENADGLTKLMKGWYNL